MTWVAFVDEAAFHAFHDAACSAHGIPYPGRNAATGAVALSAQWVTAYATPIDDHGTIKADVPDDDVVAYALTPTAAPVYVDPETGLSVADPPTPVSWDYAKDPGERLRERMADAEPH